MITLPHFQLPHSSGALPLSDSILGEQALAVTDDKVSVLELRVQPVWVSTGLKPGTAPPWEVTAYGSGCAVRPSRPKAGDRLRGPGVEVHLQLRGDNQRDGRPPPFTLGFSG